MNNIISIWKSSLQRVLTYYETRRGDLKIFYPTLFLFFITLNMVCYWWALITGFPQYLRGAAAWHYFKLSLPVGCLGAVFDSLSFFVTIYIIRRATHFHSRRHVHPFWLQIALPQTTPCLALPFTGQLHLESLYFIL